MLKRAHLSESVLSFSISLTAAMIGVVAPGGAPDDLYTFAVGDRTRNQRNGHQVNSDSDRTSLPV